MVVTELTGAKAMGLAPAVGKTAIVGLGATLSWGVLTTLGLVALGTIYLTRKLAGEMNVRVTDLEA
jgi:hypothetical protein